MEGIYVVIWTYGAAAAVAGVAARVYWRRSMRRFARLEAWALRQGWTAHRKDLWNLTRRLPRAFPFPDHAFYNRVPGTVKHVLSGRVDGTDAMVFQYKHELSAGSIVMERVSAPPAQREAAPKPASDGRTKAGRVARQPVSGRGR